MIRLKCPKCSEILSLDDSEAGQVAKCTDCGAKFRVPDRKGTAAARAAKGPEKAAAPAKRAKSDKEEEDNEDQPGKKKPPKKQQDPERKSPVAIAIGFLPCLLLLGLGSIFINRLGIIVAGVSIILMLACGLMVYRTSVKDSLTEAIMAVGFLVLAGAGIGGMFLNEARIEAKRKETKQLLKMSEAPPPRTFQQA